jgi:4-hydroxy-tetrahydrodipicolinate synthase
MALFTGAGTALVTPFVHGEVDYQSMGQLIDWQIEQGIGALIICGTTGEASTLTDKEHIETVRYAVNRADRKVPVIGGAGSNDTKHAIDMSLELEEAGVDGLLLVTPYYNKCTKKGLVAHYNAIADQVETPIILYSVPSRTGVNISPDSVRELRDHPNIVAIKEASGNISQVVEIAAYADDDFALYSGNDDMIIPVLSVGGIGAISTVANIIPSDVHKMATSYLENKDGNAAKMQLSMKPLIDAMFCEVNPIPIKAALSIMGKIRMEYRQPLCDPDPESLKTIRRELQAYGLA